MKFNRKSLNICLFLTAFIFLIGIVSAGNYNYTVTGTPDFLNYNGVQPNVYLAFDGNWSTFGNTTNGYMSWAYLPPLEAIINSSLIKSARWNVRTESGDYNFTFSGSNVVDCYSSMFNFFPLTFISLAYNFSPPVFAGLYGLCPDLTLFGDIADNNIYENTFVYEIENDTIENVVITNPSVTSSPIYQVMESSGAGLAIFIEYMNKGFPILLLGLMLVAVFVIIGSGIRELIKRFSYSHK